MISYDIGGRTRLPNRLRTVTPLVLLAAFTIRCIGWTTSVRFPQLAGVGGIAHVRV